MAEQHWQSELIQIGSRGSLFRVGISFGVLVACRPSVVLRVLLSCFNKRDSKESALPCYRSCSAPSLECQSRLVQDMMPQNSGLDACHAGGSDPPAHLALSIQYGHAAWMVRARVFFAQLSLANVQSTRTRWNRVMISTCYYYPATEKLRNTLFRF